MKNWPPLVPLIPVDFMEADNNAAKIEREKKDIKKSDPEPENKCDECGQERTCIFVANCPKFVLIIS